MSNIHKFLNKSYEEKNSKDTNAKFIDKYEKIAIKFPNSPHIMLDLSKLDNISIPLTNILKSIETNKFKSLKSDSKEYDTLWLLMDILEQNNMGEIDEKDLFKNVTKYTKKSSSMIQFGRYEFSLPEKNYVFDIKGYKMGDVKIELID